MHILLQGLKGQFGNQMIKQLGRYLKKWQGNKIPAFKLSSKCLCVCSMYVIKLNSKRIFIS